MHKLFTEKELAAELGLSAWSIRRFRLNEGLPVCKVGGRFFYRAEVVDTWLKQRETIGTDDDPQMEDVGIIRAVKA